MSQGPPEGPNSGQPDGIQSNELPKDFVLEAGVLKMSRQAFEAIFDQARLLNTRNPADLARITEAFEKHFGETELNMRKRMRDECAREIVQKLAELPDNVSLVE